MTNDGLGVLPERADFEAWAVSAFFADRDAQGRVFFHRNGGDGMWEAYCAGAGDQRGRDARASRDYLNAMFPSGSSSTGELTQCDMHDDESR